MTSPNARPRDSVPIGAILVPNALLSTRGKSAKQSLHNEEKPKYARTRHMAHGGLRRPAGFSLSFCLGAAKITRAAATAALSTGVLKERSKDGLGPLPRAALRGARIIENRWAAGPTDRSLQGARLPFIASSGWQPHRPR